MSPEFHLKSKSDMQIVKIPKSFISFLKVSIEIEYEIFPNINVDLKHNPRNYEKLKIFSKEQFEYKTIISIGKVRIPGKITIYDFGVERISLKSQLSIKTFSEECKLKGTIKTGAILQRRKAVHNIKSEILRAKDSCRMNMRWEGSNIISMTFSFKLKFDWNNNEKINSSLKTNRVFYPKQSNLTSTSIADWLSSKK